MTAADRAGPTRQPVADDRPLAGRAVIVCRATVDAAGLLARLAALGALPVTVPLHERAEPADEGRALNAAVDRIGRYRWIVVTSVNGVRALLAALGSERLPTTVDVAAIGPATADALAGAEIAVTLLPDAPRGAELAEAFPSAAPGDRVLAPLAAAAGDELVAGLTAKGYAIDRVDAYRMAEPPEQPSQQAAVADADAVLFTAPSIVDRFVGRFSLDGVPSTVVCIGPTTGARARSLGLVGIVEAEDPSEDGLIEALLATLGP